MAVISGWGRGTWSEGEWGTPLPVVVTGVSRAGAVGSVAFVGSVAVALEKAVRLSIPILVFRAKVLLCLK